MSRPALPIDSVLPEVIAGLRRHGSLVLHAPTGAGKTTRVPPAILDATLPGPSKVIVLEPRRLAARAAARRMAMERGVELGSEIGYQVRFDRRAGPRTRILVVTPGILLRRLQDDPFLEDTGTVVFDEFHERGLESDLALGMVRLVQQTVRPELRLVIMSATLEVQAVAHYMSDCPVVASEGRLYPVEVRYQPRGPRQPWPAAAAEAVTRVVDETAGDVLVFLPGVLEIRQTARHLEPLATTRDLAVVPLYGDLPPEHQDLAMLPQTRRRIVLATNVAETSVTVEGITAVVDTGLARMPMFDPAAGLDRLQLVPIAQDSAEQRAGRAGRTQPGLCIRLWSEANHRARPERTDPEVHRVDLAGAVLQLLRMGETDLGHFPWLEPPRTDAIEQALELLRQLGALKGMSLTDTGRLLARLPVHPRLGRLLLEGGRSGAPDRAALAAALLSERDPFLRPERISQHTTSSDVQDRVEALEAYERSGQITSSVGTLNRGMARCLLRARDQLVRLLRQETAAVRQEQSSEDAMLRALLAAFPDRVARRRESGGRGGIMVGGRGVRLAPWSGVTESDLFICVDVDAGGSEALVRQASAIQRAWLPAERVTTSIEVFFDPTMEQVAAWKRVRYADLLLEESQAALPSDEETARVLARAAADHLDRVLPAADSAAGLYLTRARCLREWMPELGLPAFDENELRQLLSWLCVGRRSFGDLRQSPWLDALQSKLSHVQRQALEREAPERLVVPSGSRLALRYEQGRPPVLAVRIQELFGLAETPRIAGGRVPVLLHLLAPNYRLQQVTDDLQSFWKSTYPQVRKELRARYPKHAWPEDPWSATPERRPRRRTGG